MLEKDIQRQILRWLNSQRGIYAFKVAQGMYSQIGISDIIACVNGKFVAFEIKRPGAKATKLQKYFLYRINECGGHGYIVYSLDEVKEIVRRLKNEGV